MIPGRHCPAHGFRATTFSGIAALLACGACGTSTATPGDLTQTTAPSSSAQTRLVVLAAASLRDVFTELEGRFEAEHSDIDVVLSFAGSSDLADQILAGAPADVFAAADKHTMDRVADAQDVASPVSFATNRLTVVTPPDNPGGVATLADLGRNDLKVVVCAPVVPCGAATDAVAATAGIDIHRVSEESSVTDVLTKVTSGDADAGLVYVTDALAAGKTVSVVDGPADEEALTTAVNTYPISVLTRSAHPGPAADWVDLVTGPTGAQVLADAGFGAP